MSRKQQLEKRFPPRYGRGVIPAWRNTLTISNRYMLACFRFNPHRRTLHWFFDYCRYWKRFKVKVFLLCIFAALCLTAQAQTGKAYPTESFARVDTFNGLYVFFAAHPLRPDTVLAKVNIDYNWYPTVKFVESATAFSRASFPGAQALIFYFYQTDSAALHWDVVKFK